ncbi:MAG TPA: MFS transporter [Rhizobiales bacterium]|nr:MFS transporter [Hyphomicrobiales bacterium]
MNSVNKDSPTRQNKKRFSGIAIAGITFQAGSAAVDSSTIMAALVHQLTGNPVAVGAVTAILRFGWLFPQIFVGFLAGRGHSSLYYYRIGAFGRATALAILALLLALGQNLPPHILAVAVMILWTAYAFVSGIVAVPYNDIVARSVPSKRRSRLLATRFFGGGILALGVAAIADRLVGHLPFPASYAAILAMAALLMYVSSSVFTALGEPETAKSTGKPEGFIAYLREGVVVFRKDSRFRHFVFAQWCGGAVLIAMPFYVVQASANGFDLTRIALLLAAQTAGALVSNALWGWWGDHHGKGSLLETIAIGRIFPPLCVLALGVWGSGLTTALFAVYIALFFILGALMNGLTIAVIGFLMEISPDDRRPAYSGYLNALTAPAFLFPLLGGVFASFTSLTPVFIISMLAALFQALLIHRLRKNNRTAP